MMLVSALKNVSARDQWQFLIACALSLTLLIVDEQTQLMTQVRMVLSTLMQPIEQLARLPENWASQGNQVITDKASLRNEVERLRNQLLLLNYEKQQAAQIVKENERLRMLLGVSSHINQGKLIISSVVDHNPSPYKRLVKLNKGMADGVTVGLPVMDAQGMMGQIISTAYQESDLLLITDIDTQIPVMVQRTGARGILQGKGDSDELTLKFLPTTANIREGDLLETSGIDGRYPRGLPVAEVVDVESQAGAIFWKITAQPLAKLNSSREVLIVLDAKKPTENSEEQP
ncbi:MAG: rod shape-determining protein MreC [Gammaproteobacteria bacterium]|nr:rod shape-determining protein MreC [Gammaproteobacteria bacterium]